MRYRLEPSNLSEGKTKLIFDFNEVEMVLILLEDIETFSKSSKTTKKHWFSKPETQYTIKIYKSVLKNNIIINIVTKNFDHYSFIIKTLNKLL